MLVLGKHFVHSNKNIYKFSHINLFKEINKNPASSINWETLSNTFRFLYLNFTVYCVKDDVEINILENA